MRVLPGILLGVVAVGCAHAPEEKEAEKSAPVEAREETAEEILELLRRSAEPWAEFGPGSWVQYRSQTTGAGKKHDASMQVALLSRGADGVTLEHRNLRKARGEDGREWMTPADKATTSPGEAMKRESLLESGRETVEAAGRRIACRVFDERVSMGENTGVQRIWYACDPSLEPRVVRAESIWRQQSGQESSRSLSIVLEFAKPVEVAGRTVRAWRTSLVVAGADGKWKSVGELISSPEVPGGYVRYATMMTFGTFENTVLSEVIGFSAVPR